MKRSAIVFCSLLLAARLAEGAQEWPQWGQNPRHTGSSSAVGQTATHILADVVYDPFVDAEKADPFAEGDLLVHYQVPIIDGNDIYMMSKGGQYTDITHWDTQTWIEKRLRWQGGNLVEKWSYTSDWYPVPFGTPANGPFWEPVFHPALSGSVLYVPGAFGAIWKLDKLSGGVLAHIQPFGSDPDTFTLGPLTVDGGGNVYYQVMRFKHGNPWGSNVEGSWLVKVSSSGQVQTATFASLTPGVPQANDKCQGTFNTNQLPFPPSPDAVAPLVTCGVQRPLINLAPAVANDGTIYVATVAHFSDRTSFLVAVNNNLTPKWVASLSERLNDGCDVLVPPSGTPGGCRVGAHVGVDPATNRPGSGRLIDDSTASPVIAPDGSIILGTYTRFNHVQGHLLHFSSTGQFLNSYLFGWDTTPSIWAHDGTYSVILKDNHYSDVGSYCNDPSLCPPDRTASTPSDPEAYFLTQLSPNLTAEWTWHNTNQLSCTRQPNGQVTCVSDHPQGFEFCVNAAVVDAHGVTYVNSEDGNLYVVQQGGTLRESLFLDLALGAAYTPVSMTSDGKIVTQNDGHLFIVGN